MSACGCLYRSNCRLQGFSFTLKTPERTFLMSAQSESERQQWMEAIAEVLNTPPTPQHRARERAAASKGRA